MKYINLIDGEKGGVGKSTFGYGLLQYHHDQGTDFVAVVADRSQAEVVQIFDGKLQHPIEYAYLTEEAFETYQADRIADIAAQDGHHVIVDLPAQTSRAQEIWMKDKLEGVRDEGAAFVKWFVTSGEQNSVAQFCESVESNGDKIPHILVRNLFFTTHLQYDYSNPEANKPLGKLLKRYRVPMVNFPSLLPKDLDVMRLHRYTLGEAQAAKELGVMGRQRIKNFLKLLYAELEAVEVTRDMVGQRPVNTTGRQETA